MAPRSEKKKKKKNPFSDCGLDKFRALLADLDHEKQRIYRENGAKDVAFIRFVYSEVSQKVKPIIVKAKKQKEKPQNDNNLSYLKRPPRGTGDGIINPSSVAAASRNEISEEGRGAVPEKKMEKGKSRIPEELRKLCCRVLAVLVMILLFLAIQGRLFAILCTSMAWYCVPTLLAEKASTGKKPEKQSGCKPEIANMARGYHFLRQVKTEDDMLLKK